MGEEQINNFIMVYKDDDDKEIRIPWDSVQSFESCVDVENNQNEIRLFPFQEEITLSFNMRKVSRTRYRNLVMYGWRAKSLYPRWRMINKAILMCARGGIYR